MSTDDPNSPDYDMRPLMRLSNHSSTCVCEVCSKARENITKLLTDEKMESRFVGTFLTAVQAPLIDFLKKELAALPNGGIDDINEGYVHKLQYAYGAAVSTLAINIISLLSTNNSDGSRMSIDFAVEMNKAALNMVQCFQEIIYDELKMHRKCLHQATQLKDKIEATMEDRLNNMADGAKASVDGSELKH